LSEEYMKLNSNCTSKWLP